MPEQTAYRGAHFRDRRPIPLALDVGYGKLLIQGPRSLEGIEGCFWNDRTSKYELSLTLPTIGRVKEVLGLSSAQLASRCSPQLMTWARAAKASEDRCDELLRRMESGWRTPLAWKDARAGTSPVTGQLYKTDEIGADGLFKHRAPFAHQEVMATLMAELEGAGIWGEVGTGKTRAAAVAAEEKVRRGEIDLVIVFTKTRVTGTWAREVPLWSGLRAVRLDGSIAQRTDAIRRIQRNLDQFRGSVIILNWEASWRMEQALLDLCRSCRVGLVGDESQKVKNPQAKTSKTFMRLAQKCPWRVCLTGTPVTNEELDIWSQFYCIDYGITLGPNFVQFRREYFTQNPYNTFELNARPGAVERMRDRMSRRSVRFRKDDCLDLPPRLYTVEEADMQPKQRAAYVEMAERLLVDLERIDSEMAEGESRATIQLTMILRLCQITSGFLPNDVSGELLRFSPNPKLELLDDLVRTSHESGTSTIVWAWYQEDVRAICERMADLRPLRIVGGMSVRESDEAERAFQARESLLLVSNPASGGAGITLTASAQAYYYSQNYDAEARWQSEGRNHRAGSEIHQRVVYTDLGLRNTIDAVIREALQAKTTRAEAVVAFRRFLTETV